MKRPGIWMLIALAFAGWTLLGGTLMGACAVEDKKEEDLTDDEKPTPEPSTYTKVMEGIAVGDRVYVYEGGLWEEADDAVVPAAGRPFRSVDFANPADGWVSGVGTIYHVVDGEWIPDAPLIQTNVPIERITIGADGRVWALANRFEDHGGHIFVRGLDGVWIDHDLDAEFPDGGKAVDLAERPDGSVSILLRVGQSFYLRTFSIDGVTVTTDPVYQFDPVNWLTFVSLGISPAGAVWIGGHLNSGINDYGGVWDMPEPGVLNPQVLPTAACPVSDVTRFVRIDQTVYALGICGWTTMYANAGGAWSAVNLPGEKGSAWRVNDMSFIDPQTGWAVGYSDKQNVPLFLLRDPAGWILVPPPDDSDAEGLALYGVQVWPTPAGDDDVSDDDAADDDVADDDVADDDVADDDVADDDTADDDATDDDTTDDDDTSV